MDDAASVVVAHAGHEVVGLPMLSTVTELPSRLRTVSRVLQVPALVIQCGNRARE